jgi:hypothetical protein
MDFRFGNLPAYVKLCFAPKRPRESPFKLVSYNGESGKRQDPDSLMRFYYGLGSIINEDIIVKCSEELFKRVCTNRGSIIIPESDAEKYEKDPVKYIGLYSNNDSGKYLFNQLRFEMFRWLINDVMSIKNELGHKRRGFDLGPEIETFANYELLCDCVWFVGSPLEGTQYYSLGPKMFGANEISTKFTPIDKNSGFCDFALKCASRVKEYGQRKNFMNFFFSVLNFSIVVYLGSFPGEGWREALKYKRNVFVLAFDPRYKRKRAMKCKSLFYEGYYNYVLEIDEYVLEAKIIKNYVNAIKNEFIKTFKYRVFLSDVREDISLDIQGEEYEQALQEELMTMDTLYEEIYNLRYFNRMICKIRVSSLIRLENFMSYILIPECYYFQNVLFGRKTEVIGILDLGYASRINATKDRSELILKWVQDVYNYRSTYNPDFYLKNLLMLKIFPYNIFNFPFVSEDIINAVYCLTDSRNSQRDIVKFVLSYPSIRGIMKFGDGRKRKFREFGKVYEDVCLDSLRFLMNNRTKVKELIHFPVYYLSDLKYYGRAGSWRIFFRMLPENIFEEDIFLSDMYIKVMTGEMKKVLGDLNEYNRIRDEVCRRNGFYSMHTNEVLSSVDNSKNLSVSGHMFRILLTQSYIPINVHLYTKLILGNFYLQKQNYLNSVGNKMIKIYMGKRRNFDHFLPVMAKELWHNGYEWMFGALAFDTYSQEYLGRKTEYYELFRNHFLTYLTEEGMLAKSKDFL